MCIFDIARYIELQKEALGGLVKVQCQTKE